MPIDDLGFVVPLIRRQLREEIRCALAARDAGEAIDAAYLREELEAFENLRGFAL